MKIFILYYMFTPPKVCTFRRSAKNNVKAKRTIEEPKSIFAKSAREVTHKKDEFFEEMSGVLQINGRKPTPEQTIIHHTLQDRVQKRFSFLSASKNIENLKNITKKCIQQYTLRIMTAEEPIHSRKTEDFKSMHYYTLSKKAKTSNNNIGSEGVDKLKTNQETIRSFTENETAFKTKLKNLEIRRAMMSEKYKQYKGIEIRFRRSRDQRVKKSSDQQKKKIILQIQPEEQCSPWTSDKDFFQVDLQWPNFIETK